MPKVLPALLAASLLLTGGCASERARPSPLESSEPVALEVELLAPQTNDVARAGDSVPVRVRAGEAAGRLHAVGYVARRFGAQRTTVDSTALTLEPVADTTHVFALALPDTLVARGQAQIDIRGLAFGPDAAVVITEPKSIIVIP